MSPRRKSGGRAAQNSDAHGYGLRTVCPSAWPQYPYNSSPETHETSAPVHEISFENGISLRMRDGVELLLDVYRPSRPAQKFPALCSFSPYTRQLQRDSAPIGQNEAGISEFWTSRGYAHIIVDVRGTNGSGGSWDMWGPAEQEDICEVIEWVAQQPWCTGAVGMMGCSYFGMVQNLAASRRPPSLKAIFPYDAATDIYRDAFFPGGIPNDWARFWFTQVTFLNGSSGRTADMSGINSHIQTIFSLTYPYDTAYYRERSAWPVLENVIIPAYFGCDWDFHSLHLRGAFDGWERISSTSKRMLIGPKPYPGRPFAAYHGEALRWYDQFLKGMDTGVLDGPPIQLWVPGDNVWRGEYEWPLARTQFSTWHLDSSRGGILSDTPPNADGEAVLHYDPADDAWHFGRPVLTFRTNPLDTALEVTGPVEACLEVSSTAEDTDWIVVLQDEGPDGTVRELSRGYLRSSHRRTDPTRSRPHQPWHPHDRKEPLTPNRPEKLQIEVVATSNVFLPLHRIRVEISNCDSAVRPGALTNYSRTLLWTAVNTVHTGRGRSTIVLPIIPR